MLRRFILVVAACLAAVVPAGCAVEDRGSHGYSSTEASSAAGAAAPIKAMTVKRAQQLLAENLARRCRRRSVNSFAGKLQGDFASDSELIVAV